MRRVARDLFAHCRLSKGARTKIAWVPLKKAVVGSTLKGVRGLDGWYVESSGAVATKKALKKRRSIILR